METPSELSDRLVEESAKYSQATEELTEILRTKSVRWLELRKNVASDTRADREWDSTMDGIMEMSLRLKLKALEKSMSAIKTRLRVVEMEVRNLV